MTVSLYYACDCAVASTGALLSLLQKIVTTARLNAIHDHFSIPMMRAGTANR